MPIRTITTDGLKLTNPTIEGTVGAGTGLTMPAFTGGGNISLGANKLITTNLLIKEAYPNIIGIRNAADTGWRHLECGWFYPAGGIDFKEVITGEIRGPNTDNRYFFISARDNGVGLVEVARSQGAVEPHLLLTHPKIGARSLPDASVDFRGFMYRVEGAAGVKDVLYVCEKNAADAYVWTAIT